MATVCIMIRYLLDNMKSTELYYIMFRYLLDKMKGMELYDLWLRTGHRDPESWIGKG